MWVPKKIYVVLGYLIKENAWKEQQKMYVRLVRNIAMKKYQKLSGQSSDSSESQEQQ